MTNPNLFDTAGIITSIEIHTKQGERFGLNDILTSGVPGLTTPEILREYAVKLFDALANEEVFSLFTKQGLLVIPTHNISHAFIQFDRPSSQVIQELLPKEKD